MYEKKTRRRDLANLHRVARLGLRAEDARSLRLDQIDGARGRITLVGKGRRENRLPLPQEVGDPRLPRTPPSVRTRADPADPGDPTQEGN